MANRRAEEFFDAAGDAMTDLDKKENLVDTLPDDYFWNQRPERRDGILVLSYVNQNGLCSHIVAEYNDEVDVLEVGYEVFDTYSVEDRDERIKVSSGGETGTFGHAEDAIADAVEKAYQESREVEEDELWNDPYISPVELV